MIRRFRTIVALTAALCGATAAHAQYSTPMRDVENPDRTPFMVSASVTISGFTNDFAIFTLPVGSRYFFDQIGVTCQSPAGDSYPQAYLVVYQAVTPTFARGFSFPVGPVQYAGASPSSTAIYTVTRPVKAFHDASVGAAYVNIYHTLYTSAANCTAVAYGHTLTP